MYRPAAEVRPAARPPTIATLAPSSGCCAAPMTVPCTEPAIWAARRPPTNGSAMSKLESHFVILPRLATMPASLVEVPGGLPHQRQTTPGAIQREEREAVSKVRGHQRSAPDEIAGS